ncbi:helicase-related protein [Croceicoccus sp. BE223]|uniref:helicase-related protein n=1 Tax=Croceicoccus sp. BE223 TaxID=2817716 RepID=UPI00286461CC|nr:helicase-related protein [Croceicoccus sp. BE223]MDR7102179.1 ATP-dependent RNA helicase SUPV3L1/SUV3 [Croceicoccus sp. BE223]
MVRGTSDGGIVKAVLGPTNTGKTHLAVERLCAHSSGQIGFPLRLLAREVYDRVVAIKGPDRVALITGEERIDPPNARWKLCTVEAMDRDADVAFVAVDEAQLGADPERGHVFTDRLLHARGREETMILGSAALTPMIEALVPEAEVVSRPRFSTLSHAGSLKLSRLPPRSAVVAFSAEEVYTVAEMLRRFRGGAAVVMGALSPQTRNKQVAMFQSGEVDYIVATDAIGMGLNLDVAHVAFAGLAKFDGHRRRRLTVAEMAQIAGRAGRHQKDGTFGTLSGSRGGSGAGVAFTEDEIHAIEGHRFPPIDRLMWRDARPRLDSIDTLIADLSAAPDHPALAPAPEAIDLAVARILADRDEVRARAKGKAMVGRFWEVCSLPDFRSLGAENHARFVERLWQDLSSGTGRLGHDYVAGMIAQLDDARGDIDTLQGRIAAIRSWAYIAQRPDWVLDREEMAARARAVEAKLSDALHQRLTERFVNRRTAVLMKKLGGDAALLPVSVGDGGAVLVDGEEIGRLEGFRFDVDPQARLETRRLLLAAAERHLPGLLNARADALLADAADHGEGLVWRGEAILWQNQPVARLAAGRRLLEAQVRLEPSLAALPGPQREKIARALQEWLARTLERRLEPLVLLDRATQASEGGPDLRALLIALRDAGGALARRDAGLETLDPGQRTRLRKLGVRVGALDIFMPAMGRAAAQADWAALARLAGRAGPPLSETLAATLPAKGAPPLYYRRAAQQFVRVDLAERLLHAAHQRRERWGGAPRRRARGEPARFALDPTLALSMGLTTRTYAELLRQAGFIAAPPAVLAQGGFGPPGPPLWRWKPRRTDSPPARRMPTERGTTSKGSEDPARPARAASAIAEGNPFAGLAELIR